jgi:hypothetical protein
MATTNKLGGSVKTLIGGVLWILGACWFWYHSFGNPLDELALIRGAQIAPGFIVDTWEEPDSGPEGGTLWFHGSTYHYRTPDGREFTQKTGDRSGMLKEEFQDLQKPYPIEVEYLSDNPAVSRIKGDGCRSVMEWLWRKVGLGSFLLAMLLSPGIVVLRDGIRNMRIDKMDSRKC